MLQGINEELALPVLQQRRKIGLGKLYGSVLGRVVMVTGAGGSIGSELVVQLAASKPAQLILVDNCELNLYEINMTLAENGFEDRLPLILDVRDRKGMKDVFERYRPEIVFHAAALKHVPLLENEHNLIEATMTNVMATWYLAKECREFSCRFVLVSTDKAVNPSSVMGLTKRVAEIATACHSPDKGEGFLQVRFGNVLGSSGSVVPLFRRQIAQGGPVTVTHPEMTRYLMTIRQAVSLVLEAADLHRGLSSYGMYILDMGKPVKIMDLALNLIEQAGLRPNEDIRIEVIGIRPGEKLSEELSYDWEEFLPTTVEGVRCAHNGIQLDGYKKKLTQLLSCISERDGEGVRIFLNDIVPQYDGDWV